MGYYAESGVGAFKLPRWLTPPKFVRDIAGAVLRGTQVTVPTPVGPQTFDLGNPADMALLKNLVTGTKVSTRVGPRPPSAMERVTQTVEAIPGGWLTLAAVGVGLFLVMGAMRPRVSRRG